LQRGVVFDLILPPFATIDFWQLSIPPSDQILNHVRYKRLQRGAANGALRLCRQI
jgi:hypothetical protein